MSITKAEDLQTVKVTVAVQMIYVTLDNQLIKYPMNTTARISIKGAEELLTEKELPFEKVLNVIREKQEYVIPFETLENQFKP